MKCKRGQKQGKQIKAGKTRAESQIYKCKHCGKTYMPNPKERKYSEEIKRQANKVVYRKNSSTDRVKVIEMDELYTYAYMEKTKFT